MAANKSSKGVNKMLIGLEPETKKGTEMISVPEQKVEEAPKAGNRRRKFADDAVTKFISVQLLESEVKFLEKYGGEFGGKTGYIRRLVQQEMQRVIGQ